MKDHGITLKIEGVLLTKKQVELSLRRLHEYHRGECSYGQFVRMVKTACQKGGHPLNSPEDQDDGTDDGA